MRTMPAAANPMPSKPDPIRLLAAEFFAGRSPTVPDELSAAVETELARRLVTPSGLRAFGGLYQALEGPTTPALVQTSQAIWVITNAYGRSDVRIRTPLPRTADRETALALGMTVVSGPLLEKTDLQFLFPAAGPDGCRIRRGGWGLSELDPMTLPADPVAANALLKERVPTDWRTSDEAKALASAFAGQMTAEAEAAGRPPLIGSFVMKPPDYLPLLGAMDADHIRLIIHPTGIWCSFVFADGEIAPLWWSPRRVGTFVLPGRLAWAARVFLACLWRDATVVKNAGAFRVKAIGSRRGREGDGPQKPRVVILPRSIRTMEWSDDEFKLYYDGQGRDAHNVRAHYRKLPENWRASEDAIRQADRFGYPAPPDGFTFVRPYRVGDEDAPPPPRVVARGLQVAGVTLARL